MQRPAVFALIVAALLGIGFGVGYWSRSTQQSEAGKATTPPAATAVDPEPPPSKVVVEPDELGAMPYGPGAVGYRFAGGPVTIRLRVYVDFEDNGVRKRAIYRAEDFHPPLPNQTHAAFARDGRFDVSDSSGTFILDPTRMVLQYGQLCRLKNETNTALVQKANRVPFRWDREWSIAHPELIPVLDFATVEASSDRIAPFAAPSPFQSLQPVSRIEVPAWSEALLFYKDFPGQHAGTKGIARLVVSVVAHPSHISGTRETAVAEIDARFEDVEKNPTSTQAHARLSLALVDRFKRFEPDRGSRGVLEKDAAGMAGSIFRAEPGNVAFRVMLRDRLLDHAYELAAQTQRRPETTRMPEVWDIATKLVPNTVNQAITLVPSVFDIYFAAARPLARLNDPSGQTGDTRLQAYQLIRDGLGQHRDDPVFLREKLEALRSAAKEFDAEFGPDVRPKLIDDIRRWLAEADQAPSKAPPIPKADP
jgi:hypothetical protein